MEAETELLSAARELLADVRRRHPGEEIRCEYMRALDAAISKLEAPAKRVMMCGCGKVLENPAAYAAHCREAPDHFTQT